MPARASKRAKKRQSNRASRGTLATTGAFSGSGRVGAVFVVFALVAVVLFIRLAYLQTIAAPGLIEEALSARQIVMPLSPKRGTIYDRNGRVLATSIEATTVYCNPREVTDVDAAASACARALGGKPDDYKEALRSADTSFAYLKRKADVEQAQKLREADPDGVYFLEDTKRVYPNGSIGGQVIGLVDIDGKGLTGLELYYDDILGGKEGELSMEQGATGIVINGTQTRVEAVDGEDITISLDIDLQKKVEESVSELAKDVEGKSGQGLVLDAGTGEILACASTPLLDPSNIAEIPERATEAQCITRAFEPGSVFKSVTMLAALEDGSVKASDIFYCPAELPADGYIVTDAHARTAATMSATQIMVVSSNIGISQVASKLGFSKLNDKIAEYGLGMETTGVDYPGEGTGYLLDFAYWSRIQGYNISFGQGISETPLQMSRFYGALVNDGVACTPHFLIENSRTGENAEWPKKRIIQNTSAIEPLTTMLTKVVEEGTGTDAQISGYDVAGKTGTAEYVEEGKEDEGYKLGYYNVSFVGFLPNSDSKLVCFVGATEVPGEPATTAVFQDIMSFAIERYNINSTRR